MSLIDSVQQTLAGFWLDFGDALANPQNLLIDFTPQSWGLIVLFLVSRRIYPLMEWIVQITVDDAVRKKLKNLKQSVEGQFKDPMTLGDVMTVSHGGHFFFEFVVLFIMYILDFWTICEEREATAIQFGNAASQSFTTILPLLGFFWLFSSFDWHKELRKKVSPLVDLVEGVLLFLIYNFAIHFQDVYDRMVCAHFSEKDIQQSLMDDTASTLWRRTHAGMYETSPHLHDQYYDFDSDLSTADNQTRADAAADAEDDTDKEEEDDGREQITYSDLYDYLFAPDDTSTETTKETGDTDKKSDDNTKKTGDTTKDDKTETKDKEETEEEDDDDDGKDPNAAAALYIFGGLAIVFIIVVLVFWWRSRGSSNSNGDSERQ